VHLSRFVPLLREAGFRVAVLNHFDSTEMPFVVGALKRNPVNYYRLPKKFPARILHYHHSRWSTLMALTLGRGNSRSRYVLTLHSPQIGNQLKSRIPLVARLTEWALRRFDAVIVVNPKIQATIQSYVDGRIVDVVPAFLEASHEGRKYDASTELFLESGRILLVSASRIRFLPDGRDLYGLDLAVDAFARLAPERPELRLALFIAAPPTGRKAASYLAGLRLRLDQTGLRERVLVTFGLPLVPAFRNDAVLLRPTRSEGDALSVREARHAGVPVVASDVVDRPAGVATFAGGNLDELCATLDRALDQPTENASERKAKDAAGTSTGSFSEGLVRIYREQLALARLETAARHQPSIKDRA
jgi:glycosyltransferase involved in cell wall biosynthesis